MTGEESAARDRRRERWIAAAVVTALVILRSIVFVFQEQAFFDSDQAIIGLMAKHLSELRAFPVFYYGQNYMLGVEAYLAAPVFAIAGVSVTALKLPLFVINLACALLLLRVLERDAGLRPRTAVVPVLFFALPSPAVAAYILAANGGNLAPFLYTLLIWMTRLRPNWCGLLLGIGFLQREFTVYALAALLGVELVQGTVRTREGLWRRLAMLRAAAEVWLVVQWIKYFSSAAGPGTSMADVYKPRDNLLELGSRICGDWTMLPAGVVSLATSHWPVLFGTRPMPLREFGIESAVAQGVTWSSWILAAALALPAIVIARQLIVDRRWRREYTVCAYLTLVGLWSAAGYVAGRCGQLEYLVLRYELLSVLGAVGLGAWLLVIARDPWVRRSWTALACACALVTGGAHARLIAEYIATPPAGSKQLILRHLEARGLKYARSDYWLAYALTFLADERIIVASDDFLRIPAYNRIVEAHKSESVRIARMPCEGGKEVIPRVYFCEP